MHSNYTFSNQVRYKGQTWQQKLKEEKNPLKIHLREGFLTFNILEPLIYLKKELLHKLFLLTDLLSVDCICLVLVLTDHKHYC